MTKVEAPTPSRFNFIRATKALGLDRSLPKINYDAVRLTNHKLLINKNLVKRFANANGKKSARLVIDKDPSGRALRITVVTDSKTPRKEIFSLGRSKEHTEIFTARPAALFDMPNGNYLEDLKEKNVFVLES